MKIEIPNNNLVISFFSFFLCVYIYTVGRGPFLAYRAMPARWSQGKDGGSFGSSEDGMRRGAGGENGRALDRIPELLLHILCICIVYYSGQDKS